jgi:hypothetical protein
MADVSVRFTVAGDSEIILNLATEQAVRLIEALVRKIAEALADAERGQARAGWPEVSHPSMSTPPPYRPPTG